MFAERAKRRQFVENYAVLLILLFDRFAVKVDDANN